MGRYRSREFNERVMRLTDLDLSPTIEQSYNEEPHEYELMSPEEKRRLQWQAKERGLLSDKHTECCSKSDCTFHVMKDLLKTCPVEDCGLKEDKVKAIESDDYFETCSIAIVRGRSIEPSLEVRLAYAHIHYKLKKLRFVIGDLESSKDDRLEPVKQTQRFEAEIDDEDDIELEGDRPSSHELYMYLHMASKPHSCFALNINPICITAFYPLSQTLFTERLGSYKSFVSVDCEQAPLEAVNIATRLAYDSTPDNRIHYAQLGHLTRPFKMKPKSSDYSTLILNIPNKDQRQSTLNLGINDPRMDWFQSFDHKRVTQHLLGLKPTRRVINDETYLTQLIDAVESNDADLRHRFSTIVGSNGDQPAYSPIQTLIVLADPLVHPFVTGRLQKLWDEPEWAKNYGQRNGILTTVKYEDSEAPHFRLAPRTDRIIGVWERRL